MSNLLFDLFVLKQSYLHRSDGYAFFIKCPATFSSLRHISMTSISDGFPHSICANINHQLYFIANKIKQPDYIGLSYPKSLIFSNQSTELSRAFFESIHACILTLCQ